MKTWIKIGLPVLLVLLAVFLLSRTWEVSVLTAPAVRGTAVNAVTGTVKVVANIDMRVKTENRGTLLENVVQPGQSVNKGDVIGLQDSKELQLQIEQVKIRLDAAGARTGLESLHKIDVERLDEELEGLKLAVELKQSSLSRLEDVQRQRRKSVVLWNLDEINLREQVKLLENELEQLQLRYQKMTTYAPFDGVIAEVFAWEGDMVNANQDIVRLVSKGRTLIMELTEEDYYGVEQDQPVTVRLASYPDRTFSGVANRMEDVANASSKTRNLFVNVDAPDSVMVPGLTGEGYLVKDERENAILIPRRGLIGNLVYVVVDGKIDVRRVRPGYLGLQQAEILEGIAEGEQVVLEDQSFLKPGESVNPVTNP